MHPKEITITQDFVHELFDYNSGVLYWRIARGSRAKPGQAAGALRPDNRVTIRIDNINYLRSRLMWLWHHGHPVPFEIDHIDNNSSNDSIENLRAATKSQNGANRGMISNNTTGHKGIYKHRGKWMASYRYMNKSYHIGLFDTIEEALKARQEAFSKVFGEFARHD